MLKVKPELTIEALQDNPWNVLSHRLPAEPTDLLLELASMAAAYCRDSEYTLMLAVRAGDHTPKWWEPHESPDAHEVSEQRAFEGYVKFEEICELYAKRHGHCGFNQMGLRAR